MNLDKIEEMWAKDSERFFDHRELPELLANDSMETPRLHAKYLQFINQFKLMLSEAEVSARYYCVRSLNTILVKHLPQSIKKNLLHSKCSRVTFTCTLIVTQISLEHSKK